MNKRIYHGHSKEKLYDVWDAMKRRCLSTTSQNYKHYGARGISICDEWMTYPPFRKWCYSNGYAEGLSIDRIDNDGNYEPNNCRFVTQELQARNTRLLCKTNISGYRGVHFDKTRKVYVARVSVKNKTVYIGSSSNKQEAAMLRDRYVIAHNMEHTLNFKREI